MSGVGADYQSLQEGEEQKPAKPVEVDEKGTSPKVGPAPDGGLRAWLVAAGASCIFFAGLGYSNSFGVFQEYYLTHNLRGKSPDDIAWIGSTMAFLQLATATIAGPLFDRFGVWVVRPASIIYFFAMMMLSLCTEFWQIMLTQGILMGIATGFMNFPAMAAVSQFFDKKRASALGAAVAGSSIGGIVFPIAFSKMLNGTSLGFGWTYFHIFHRSCLKELNFILITISMFFLFLGMWTPLFFIPTYAVTRGMDAALASYLLAIINGASLFGRVIPGVLADKYGRLNIFATGGISTGIVIMCMTTANSTAGLVVYSIFIGFTSGTIISGGSAAFSVVPKDPRNIGTYMGMGMGASSVAILIGPPINGALINRYGGFLEASMFSGIMCLVGGLVALASKAARPQGILGRI